MVTQLSQLQLTWSCTMHMCYGLHHEHSTVQCTLRIHLYNTCNVWQPWSLPLAVKSWTLMIVFQVSLQMYACIMPNCANKHCDVQTLWRGLLAVVGPVPFAYWRLGFRQTAIWIVSGLVLPNLDSQWKLDLRLDLAYIHHAGLLHGLHLHIDQYCNNRYDILTMKAMHLDWH